MDGVKPPVLKEYGCTGLDAYYRLAGHQPDLNIKKQMISHMNKEEIANLLTHVSKRTFKAVKLNDIKKICLDRILTLNLK